MTNHPRREGRRKQERRAAALFAQGPRPRPAWAMDPQPGPRSSVRFYLAVADGSQPSPRSYTGRAA